MQFQRHTVMTHGAKPLHMLVPDKQEGQIGVVNTGHVLAMFSGGTGFAVLHKVLRLAAVATPADSCFVLRLSPNAVNPAYANDPGAISNYATIVIANYTTFQFSVKAVCEALSNRMKQTDTVTLDENHVDRQTICPAWKTDRKLTVKAQGKNLFLYGDADIFSNMAMAANHNASYGDDASLNEEYSHSHFDSHENTAKSLGIMMEYYWNSHEG